MVSRIKERLTLEEMKGMFGVDEAGSVPARYHVATFPEFTPMLIAVNSEVTSDGVEDFGFWFRRENLNILEQDFIKTFSMFRDTQPNATSEKIAQLSLSALLKPRALANL